jgi:hypothetical protein
MGKLMCTNVIVTDTKLIQITFKSFKNMDLSFQEWIYKRINPE